MRDLVRLSKVEEVEGFPVRRRTLEQWRYLGKHPEIFVKIGGSVYVDLDELIALIEGSREVGGR